jgi:hypothetical protein
VICHATIKLQRDAVQINEVHGVRRRIKRYEPANIGTVGFKSRTLI